MSNSIQASVFVPIHLGNKRLDKIAAELFPDFSRSRLQQWIVDGKLTVDGETRRIRDKMVGGENLELDVILEAEGDWEAEDIPLEIVYEDDDIVVINKPSGLVVHPAAGNYSGTLLNALLYHYPGIENVPRAGIVHRLDKDTTGLMVVAKTLQAQTQLVNQLQDRSMGREYEAITMGVMTGGGVVEAPIARHPTQRTKMAVAPEGMGKEAITHYRVLKKFNAHTHIRCKLETGRTHQIRVHMSHIGYPLVGDQTYFGRFRLPKGISLELRQVLQGFQRQALHARELSLWHPTTDEYMTWEVELPADFQSLLQSLSDEQSETYEDIEF
ncbi:MAG: 23S rRNA pseudouridine(1911/1915/1917) synthase RluD [Blastopirellula sp.]|nr:23S rRNA pseudouridine(1911/1915/1917) synthase RluD [Oleispira sp.]PHR97873.1 MAG: 23S rRNA pseudouridine(1911/1915/1917) synthase RluD [Blastopirellula sp.]